MKIDILASGSSGNCIALTVGDKTILIDAGIAKTKIEKALMNIGIRPDQIEAIFITHAHQDHTKGLPIANKYQIPVYAGVEEWQAMPDGIEEDLVRGIQEFTRISEMEITPFHVHHDSYEPMGYTVTTNNYKVSVCLDTGHVDSTMLETMKNSNVYIIESNHDPKMVEASKYPNSVKARILSHIGHLSNQQTAETLSKLVHGKGERIYLVHLSSKNNMPMLAEMTTKKALHQKGLIENKHYHLEVL